MRSGASAPVDELWAVTAGIEARSSEDQRAAAALRSPVVVVAVISDTHLPRGARRIPDQCVASMRASDLILHAGDFTYPEVLQGLEELGPPVMAVHGNVDSPELYQALPEARVVNADGAKIAML